MAWRLLDITTASDPKGHGDPSAYTTGAAGIENIIFKAYPEGHIHTFSRDAGGWQHMDLIPASGAPASACAGFFACPTAYFFKAQGTHHVIWSNGHVNELFRDATGWHHADLTYLSGAPASVTPNWGAMAAYCSEAQLARFVVYIGSDQHVHRLYCDATGWHHSQLNGQPNPVQISPTGYCLGNSEHIYFVGADGHVYELSNAGGSWSLVDILVGSGAPLPAAGSHDWIMNGLTSYIVPAANSEYVVYSGWDGHLHELARSGGNPWQHSDLTAASNAPPSAAPNLARPGAYSCATKNIRHVVYCGSDGHVHDFCHDANGWHYHDMSAIAAVPVPAAAQDDAPAGFAIDADGTEHIAYLGTSGEIHELSSDNAGWHYRNLTRSILCPLATNGLIAHVPLRGRPCVTFRGQDGDIHRLSESAGPWTHVDLTHLAGGRIAVLAGSGPAHYFLNAFIGALGVIEGIAFVGADYHIHLLRGSGGITGAWNHVDLTKVSNAPSTAQPKGSSPTAYCIGLHPTTQHIVYVGADAHLHALEGDPSGWGHRDLTRAAGAPRSAGPQSSSPSGYVHAGQHVVYVGEDGHLHELYCDALGWHYDDLTQSSATLAFLVKKGTAPAAFADSAGSRVLYLGTDGHIHSLFRSGAGGWQHADLTSLSGAPPKSAPQGVAVGHVFVGRALHVVYRGQDGFAHDLYLDNLGWHYDELAITGMTSAPVVLRECFPTEYVWPGSSHPEFTYIGVDGHGYVIAYFDPPTGPQ